MEIVRKAVGYGLVVLGIVGGCATSTGDGEPTGNELLGVATFEVTELPTSTTVIGFDAGRHEVARLDLTHGRFALSGAFVDDYPGQSEVIGRKLDVHVNGHALVWETAGFEPTLHMPAHPESEWAIAAFLADPHVKRVLDTWQIGFQPTAGASLGGGEVAFHPPYDFFWAGYTGWGDENITSVGPPVRGFTPNTCGGGAAALVAMRVVESDVPNEDLIAQCCPSGSGGFSYPWAAYKKCPTVGTSTDCGTASAACKGCATYDATTYCNAAWVGNGITLAFTATPKDSGWCEANAECASGSCDNGYCVAALPLGATCWDNGTEYGSCAAGVPCVDPDSGLCKYWMTCTCGGVWPDPPY